jgi:preprotein translocase SecE subunit
MSESSTLTPPTPHHNTPDSPVATLPEEERFSLPEFFKGVGEAWGKITWPARGHLVVQVLITLLVTTFATTLIWGFDSLYKFLISTFVVGS